MLENHREGEDTQTRQQQETHEPDTLERLLGGWMETINGETQQEVTEAEKTKKRNEIDEEVDKNNHKIRTMPPKKQVTSSQAKRRAEEDQQQQNKDKIPNRQKSTPPRTTTEERPREQIQSAMPPKR